jgi:hypothetical protein
MLFIFNMLALRFFALYKVMSKNTYKISITKFINKNGRGLEVILTKTGIVIFK